MYLYRRHFITHSRWGTKVAVCQGQFYRKCFHINVRQLSKSVSWIHVILPILEFSYEHLYQTYPSVPVRYITENTRTIVLKSWNREEDNTKQCSCTNKSNMSVSYNRYLWPLFTVYSWLVLGHYFNMSRKEHVHLWNTPCIHVEAYSFHRFVV